MSQRPVMPIVHDVAQYSEAYDRLKLGIATSSNFHKIVTPQGKPSKQWREHRIGELTFWSAIRIDPLNVALRLWTVSADVKAGERTVFRARQQIDLAKSLIQSSTWLESSAAKDRF